MPRLILQDPSTKHRLTAGIWNSMKPDDDLARKLNALGKGDKDDRDVGIRILDDRGVERVSLIATPSPEGHSLRINGRDGGRVARYGQMMEIFNTNGSRAITAFSMGDEMNALTVFDKKGNASVVVEHGAHEGVVRSLRWGNKGFVWPE